MRVDRRRVAALTLSALAAISACSSGDTETVSEVTSPSGSDDEVAAATGEAASDPSGTADDGSTTTTAEPTADTTAPGGAVDRPVWFGSRPLTTLPDGSVPPQTTPAELIDRNLITVDTLAPPPADADFESSIVPLAGDPLERSTWQPDCPVTVEELSYITMTFWGFDDRPHTGEMIVNAAVAKEIVDVFATLYDARFPIEEMRVVSQADLDAPPLGDGNNTTSFSCRPVVTTSSTFSQHAYGLAVDINPFHNPYVKGELVLPELATVYLDRDGAAQKGLIVEGGVVTDAFDAIGWGWGGRWNSLKDYQHFSQNNR